MHETYNLSLWNRACPPLLLLLSLFLTAFLLHLINRLTAPVLLGIQATAAFFSTICGLVLVISGLGSSDVDDDLRGDYSGLAAVVTGAVIIWYVFPNFTENSPLTLAGLSLSWASYRLFGHGHACPLSYGGQSVDMAQHPAGLLSRKKGLMGCLMGSMACLN